MFNFDYFSKKYIKEHSADWSGVLDHAYLTLIVGGSRSEKTNALFIVINCKDIDKIYLYEKDCYEPQYQMLINKIDSTGLKYFNGSKTCIEYANNMDDIYKNL